MILFVDIIQVHQFSITKYGGKELYPTIFEKAAALGESLITNHPFVDGNKRTGFLAMTSFLRDNGYTLIASQEEAYDFTIKIATGEFKFDQIVEWLKNNTSIL